eukprot:13898287-Alexandrium_andersonii.AAC.1
MSASLVGSEMCIRDRPEPPGRQLLPIPSAGQGWFALRTCWGPQLLPHGTCLLYTSDAADDM